MQLEPYSAAEGATDGVCLSIFSKTAVLNCALSEADLLFVYLMTKER